MSHAACIESEGIVYTFGGISKLDPVSEIYTINLETLECKALEKKGYWPPPMSSHTAVINPETKKVYIYGGFIKYSPTSNIHEYNVATNEWNKLTITAPLPPSRSCHAASFFQGSMIVYGGINAEGDLLNDLWIFNIAENTWTNVDFSGSTFSPSVLF